MFSNERAKTKIFSCCTLEASGGCHSFGKSFAKELKTDYSGIARTSPFELKLFDKGDLSKSHENICITGCELFKEGILTEISKTHDLTQLKNVYLIVPPHIIIEDYKSTLDDIKETLNKELAELQKSGKMISQFTISLITTGLENEESKAHIGLPNPFPKLPPMEKSEPLASNCYGLIYFHGLNDVHPQVLSTMFEENVDKSSLPTAKDFLASYFSRVIKQANKNKILNPAVIVTNYGGNKSLIEVEAKKHNVDLRFETKLTNDEFAQILKQLGQKGGIVATNGAMTLIQSFITKCHVLFYANKQIIHDLLEQIVSLIPSSLKATAKVILGLSMNNKLLDNADQVEAVHKAIQDVFRDSLLRFEKAKTQPIPTAALDKVSQELSTLAMLVDLKDSEPPSFESKARESRKIEGEIRDIEAEIISSFGRIRSAYDLMKKPSSEESPLDQLLRRQAESNYRKNQANAALFEWAQKQPQLDTLVAQIKELNKQRGITIEELKQALKSEIEKIDLSLNENEKKDSKEAPTLTDSEKGKIKMQEQIIAKNIGTIKFIMGNWYNHHKIRLPSTDEEWIAGAIKEHKPDQTGSHYISPKIEDALNSINKAKKIIQTTLTASQDQAKEELVRIKNEKILNLRRWGGGINQGGARTVIDEYSRQPVDVKQEQLAHQLAQYKESLEICLEELKELELKTETSKVPADLKRAFMSGKSLGHSLFGQLIELRKAKAIEIIKLEALISETEKQVQRPKPVDVMKRNK